MRLFMNRVIVSGYLTRDPQLRRSDSGITVCRIRIACPSRRRDRKSGQWRTRPNFFDVAIFDEHGEEIAGLTAKGSGIAVDGHLHWNEWQGRDGRRMQRVNIVADTVHLMDDPPEDSGDRHPDGDGSGRGEHSPDSPQADDWLELSPTPTPAPVGDHELDFDLFGTGDTDAAARTAAAASNGKTGSTRGDRRKTRASRGRGGGSV